MLNVVVDVYNRQRTTCSSIRRFRPRPASPTPPIVNIGKVQNTGFDLSVGHQSADWNVTFNGSHYKNKILLIADDQTSFFGPYSTRYRQPGHQQVGQPIGAFYGYVANGYFKMPPTRRRTRPMRTGKCTASASRSPRRRDQVPGPQRRRKDHRC